MHTIKKEQTMLVSTTLLTAEASEIGLAPGEWPDFIAVLDDQDEGFLFLKAQILNLMGMYQTQDGRYQLHVWND